MNPALQFGPGVLEVGTDIGFTTSADSLAAESSSFDFAFPPPAPIDVGVYEFGRNYFEVQKS